MKPRTEDQPAEQTRCFDPESIPAELRQIQQWVLWKLEHRPGEKKPTKVPYQWNGRKALSDKPGTWSTFSTIETAYKRGGFDGVGFMFGPNDPYAGIDLDSCRNPETGELTAEAETIIGVINSYSEVSPSGTGVHTIVKSQTPDGTGTKRRDREFYCQGRYFTMTGHRLPNTLDEIAERNGDELHRLLFPELAAETAPVAAAASHCVASADDTELIKRAMAAKNGPKFARLWAGDTSDYAGDESRADLAICSHLAFWTDADAPAIDRLFRQSGLFRDKWDSKRGDSTYGQITIAKALDGVTETYRPSVLSTNGHSASAKVPPVRPTQGDISKDAAPAATLAPVIKAFRRWLYVPDAGVIYVTLGAIAANLAPGDPCWLMLVGASSGGKTEVLNALSSLPNIYAAATITEPGLLSGTSKKEKANDAKGGLLRQVGEFGILCLKDFTSVLAMNRDQRAALLAALRELFDGHWERHVGVDGGRTLSWAGKLGLLAGCTAAIDSHHVVMATMGERFVLYRLPDLNPRRQARKALRNTGHERQLRGELRDAVARLFAGIHVPEVLPTLTDSDTDRLVALASLVARCRSAVERDGHTREIELILDPEAPARIAQSLRRLYGGMRIIGVSERKAWRVLLKAGLDCMPKTRRAVFDQLVQLDKGMWAGTTTIASTIGYPTNTAKRALEDLTVHGVAERRSGGAGKADDWRLTALARELYETASNPEMSETHMNTVSDGAPLNNPNHAYDDISGLLPHSERQPHCWYDGQPLSEDEHERCSLCGGLRCHCGRCHRDCPGDLSEEAAS